MRRRAKKHQDIKSIQTKLHEILILQKEEDGIVKTYIKYRDPVKGLISKCVLGIGPHERLNEFSGPELAEVYKSCGVPVPGIQDDPIYKKQLANKFFDARERMNPTEVQTVKKSHVRASTQSRENLGDSLAELVRKNLIEAKCFGLSLKGYIGTYKAAFSRIVPSISHEAEKFPKAVKVTIRGPGF